MSGRVFISYAAEDLAAAEQVAGSLRKRGSDVWLAPSRINAGDNIVAAINEGLAASSAVLVIWSRSAAASPWVQAERDSSYARRASGAPLSFFLARLDDTETPPLFAAEKWIDLRDMASREAQLDRVFAAASHTRGEDLAERVDDAELPRHKQVDEVLRKTRRGAAVVVLAARKGGSHAFIRQVQHALKTEHPEWLVPVVPAAELGDESGKDYIHRIRSLFGADLPGKDPIVACVNGWSNGSNEFVEMLGKELSVHLEKGAIGQHPFRVVAVGSYPLYLLRRLGELSFLGNAFEIHLPDFDEADILAFMESISPGTWGPEDAGEVWRRSGGHPHLVKLIIRSWAESKEGKWADVERCIDDDTSLVLPMLTNALRVPERLEALKNCLGSQGGLPGSQLDPLAPPIALLFDGLLRRDGNRLLIRCPAVQRLVADYFAGQ